MVEANTISGTDTRIVRAYAHPRRRGELRRPMRAVALDVRLKERASMT